MRIELTVDEFKELINGFGLKIEENKQEAKNTPVFEIVEPQTNISTGHERLISEETDHIEYSKNKSKKSKRGRGTKKTGVFTPNDTQNNIYQIRFDSNDIGSLEKKAGRFHWDSFNVDLVDLFYFNSVKDTITFEEIREYVKVNPASELEVSRVIVTLRERVFDDYMTMVMKVKNECSFKVMSNDCVMVNGVVTSLKKQDCLGLIFTLQNNNVYKGMFNLKEEYSRFMDVIEFVMVCLNYDNDELISLVK